MLGISKRLYLYTGTNLAASSATSDVANGVPSRIRPLGFAPSRLALLGCGLCFLISPLRAPAPEERARDDFVGPGPPHHAEKRALELGRVLEYHVGIRRDTLSYIISVGYVEYHVGIYYLT